MSSAADPVASSTWRRSWDVALAYVKKKKAYMYDLYVRTKFVQMYEMYLVQGRRSTARSTIHRCSARVARRTKRHTSTID